MGLKELVDKKTIVERSNSYGNNFPFLVKIWKNFLKLRYDIEIPLSAGDVAFMFSLHKISRLANAPDDQDTLRDMINYAWLGIDYGEYINMLSENQMKTLIDNVYNDQNQYLEDEQNNIIVDNLINSIRQLDEQQQERYCYWCNRDCVYNQDSDWGIVKKCPLGYENWENCDFNTPIEIN